MSNHKIPGAPAVPVQPYRESYRAPDVQPIESSGFLPAKRLKDVWNSPGYRRGEYQSVGSFPDTAGRFKFELKDPITGQSVFQFTSSKGGQGEGY